jgi:acyl-CoA synthetase (AMP-forming)/AMP-acid ligase II
VPSDGARPLTLEDIVEFCGAQHLATQKIPEQLEVVPVLPRNSMGKILKQQLRAQVAAAAPDPSDGG